MLKLNRHLFTETGTDSGALTVLGTVVHRFPDPGDYLVSVRREGRAVGQRIVVVGPDHHSQTARIDLATVDEPAEGHDCSCEAEGVVCIRPDGFAVFYVSGGPGGYHVTVDPLEERDVREFDGANLTEYDTVSVTLFRPGTYTLRNELTEHTAVVEVTYPEPGDERPDEPVRIECGDRGFSETALTLAPAQGLVVEVATDARIVVELEKPHERASTDVGGDERTTQPRQPGQPRFDPRRLGERELRRELDAVERPTELRLIRAIERASRDRSGVREAIERRLHDLTGRSGDGSDDG